MTSLEHMPLLANEGGSSLQHMGDLPPVKTKGTSWMSSSSLIVANMLGAGVLGLPEATRKMGWEVTAGVLAVVTVASIYCGVRLGNMFNEHRDGHTYPDLTYAVSRGRGEAFAVRMKRLVQVIAYVYILGVCTIYLTTMKISLRSIVQECLPDTHSELYDSLCGAPSCSHKGTANLHDTAWLFITGAVVFPFIHFRNLEDVAFISYIGVLTIAVVNVVILVKCIQDSTGEAHKTHMDNYHYKFDLHNTINGITQLIFAYGGHVLMPNIQSEMRDPSQFSKAVYSSQLFMFCNYAIVGFVGFYAYGEATQSPVTLNLSDSPLRAFTNACLFLHVLGAYCINSTVLVTAVLNAWKPDMLRYGSRKERVIWWGIIAFGLLVCSVAIAIIIPFFSDLMNIYSSIGIVTLSFVLPPMLYLITFSETAGTLYSHVAAALPTRQLLLNTFMILVFSALCGLGVWSAVKDIHDKWSICDYKIRF